MQRTYPMKVILKNAKLSSVEWYDNHARKKEEEKSKQGSITTMNDNFLSEGIMHIIKDTIFSGEGNIKIYSRLRNKNICIGKKGFTVLCKDPTFLAKRMLVQAPAEPMMGNYYGTPQ
jgi:hypothetical protein